MPSRVRWLVDCVAFCIQNTLYQRNIDVLRYLQARAGCAVFVSVTSLDTDLLRRMDPGTLPPLKRLLAMGRLVVCYERYALTSVASSCARACSSASVLVDLSTSHSEKHARCSSVVQRAAATLATHNLEGVLHIAHAPHAIGQVLGPSLVRARSDVAGQSHNAMLHTDLDAGRIQPWVVGKRDLDGRLDLVI